MRKIFASIFLLSLPVHTMSGMPGMSGIDCTSKTPGRNCMGGPGWWSISGMSGMGGMSGMSGMGGMSGMSGMGGMSGMRGMGGMSGMRGMGGMLPRLKSSRLFAGPNQHPPEGFAAYGILAFRSAGSIQDREIHLMICQAYVTALAHVSKLNIKRADQMVTVWPIDSDSVADELNKLPRNQVCEKAVDNYGLAAAKQAIIDARAPSTGTYRSGPFLLAWSPSIDKGQQNALVLVSDLSHVTTFKLASKMFHDWSRNIEENPSLWNHGWNSLQLKQLLRSWFDKYGPMVLALRSAWG